MEHDRRAGKELEMAAPKSHRTLRLPPDLDIWVEQQAREQDIPVNEWLRRVLQWVREPKEER